MASVMGLWSGMGAPFCPVKKDAGHLFEGRQTPAEGFWAVCVLLCVSIYRDT